LEQTEFDQFADEYHIQHREVLGITGESPDSSSRPREQIQGNSQRLKQLDSLRGLAAVMVVALPQAECYPGQVLVGRM
jgi:hypothetical protein